jgi:NADH:ubiquinone oxidoreductase subunit 6 (subunit J)
MAISLKFILAAVFLILSAIQTLRTKSVLLSALWLAGVSVMISTLMYMLSALKVAVIELSVGAGLVTVLLVFAIGVTGDEKVERISIIPKPITGGLVVASLALLICVGRSPVGQTFLAGLESQAAQYAQARSLDLMVQVILIFSGVLGLVGILAEVKAPLDHPMADEVAASRDQDLRLMEEQSLSHIRESSPPEAGTSTIPSTTDAKQFH